MALLLSFLVLCGLAFRVEGSPHLIASDNVNGIDESINFVYAADDGFRRRLQDECGHFEQLESARISSSKAVLLQMPSNAPHRTFASGGFKSTFGWTNGFNLSHDPNNSFRFVEQPTSGTRFMWMYTERESDVFSCYNNTPSQLMRLASVEVFTASGNPLSQEDERFDMFLSDYIPQDGYCVIWDATTRDWSTDGVEVGPSSGCRSSRAGHVAIVLPGIPINTTAIKETAEEMQHMHTMQSFMAWRLLQNTSVNAAHMNSSAVGASQNNTYGWTTNLSGVHEAFNFSAPFSAVNGSNGFLWRYSEHSIHIFDDLDSSPRDLARVVSIDVMTSIDNTTLEGDELDLSGESVHIFAEHNMSGSDKCMRWDWYLLGWLTNGITSGPMGCRSKRLGYIGLFRSGTTTTTTPIAMGMLSLIRSIEEARLTIDKGVLYQTPMDAPVLTFTSESFQAAVGRTKSLTGVHAGFTFPPEIQRRDGFMWMYTDWNFNLFGSLDNLPEGFQRLASIAVFTSYGDEPYFDDIVFNVLLDSHTSADAQCMRWDWNAYEWTTEGVNRAYDVNATAQGCQSAHLGYIGLFTFPVNSTTTTSTAIATTITITNATVNTTTTVGNGGVANEAFVVVISPIHWSILFCMWFLSLSW